jgi:hypothetical protein
LGQLDGKVLKVFEKNSGDVPAIVENAVGGLAAEQTSSAVEMKNQTTQPHEERQP